MSEPIVREARCVCGDLRIRLKGEPMLVSSCCCTRCQRRTGALFGVTVYFHPDQAIARDGTWSTFHLPDGSTTFHFCPRCGSNVWWVPDEEKDVFGVAGGCFADPTLPSPKRMVHTRNKHPYVRPPDNIPLYEDAPG
jgi:hypothetical protein